jgi:arachidonate 15-lipoxygenase
MLLLPHFEGTILINWGAQKALVNDGGPFDKLFSGTMETNRELVAKRLQRSFNDSMLPHDLDARAVNNKHLFYPYRDDASKLWKVIKQWVGTYLSTYYMSDAEVAEDAELQAWAKELSNDGRVQGFGNDGSGEISTFEYLEDALTMIIFTSSAQHAAVNFSQKDFGGYTPNMPSAGYTPAPTHKDKTKQDWLDLLPPINLSESQINLAQLLSGVNYTTLGHYNWFYFWDYRLLVPQWKFKSRLKKIELEIQARNAKSTVIKYDYLLPSKIPQSINI